LSQKGLHGVKHQDLSFHAWAPLSLWHLKGINVIDEACFTDINIIDIVCFANANAKSKNWK
jgi:hypothetical protein